ncbi:MAG: PHP domain-containing protein, partial [Ruminococcus sp.]|nr:PHP domain-containing protein [Ruminococcus sp.]
MEKTLQQFLEGLNETAPDELKEAEILRLVYSEVSNVLEMFLHCRTLIPYATVAAFQRDMRVKWGMNDFLLRIKYTPDMLTADYFFELTGFLKARFPVVNGFFDDADVTLENGVFTVSLKRGGANVLKKAGIERAFPDLVREMFVTSVKLELAGVTEVSDEVYLAEQEKIISEIESSLPPPPPPGAAPAPAAAAGQTYSPKGFRTFSADFTELPIICKDAAVLMGSPVMPDEKVTKMINASEKSDEKYVCWGEVFSIETRETKSGMMIAIISFTDFTSSVTMKILGSAKKYRGKLTKDDLVEILGELKKGSTIIASGALAEDDFDHKVYMTPERIMVVKKKMRVDTAEQKRVELHCHTNMSAMDALAAPSALVKRAYSWGHRALAITDHGVVQGFPDAVGAVKGIVKEGGDFKALYGVEAYEVNNDIKIYIGSRHPKLTGEVIVFDLETTGTKPDSDRIIEIGAVKLRGLEIIDRFDMFVNPHRELTEYITELTSITDDMLKDAPEEADALKAFMEFCGEMPLLVAHNANFDCSFIREAVKRCGVTFDYDQLDTVLWSQKLLPDLEKHKLDSLAEHYGVGDFHHHRACDDAETLAKIYIEMSRAEIKNYPYMIITADMLNSLHAPLNDVTGLKTYHQIILVRNNTGLKNLYRMISDSNLKYYKRRPRIPKSELVKNREGLIIGSACEAGEVIQAYLSGEPYEKIKQIASFYDYLEIQPDGNNEFMLISEREPYDRINTVEDLHNINRFIVKLGEDLGLPVCATGDVHVLDPKDLQYRAIIMASKGFEDADKQAPLYFKTTDQMLSELAYLGEEKAFEVVVKNTNMFADRVEGGLKAFPDGTYTPFIPGAVRELQDICWKKCLSIYGDCEP